MPKRVKKPKQGRKRRDENQLAYDLVQRIAGVETTSTVPASISAYMASIGAKGGKVGGKRRLETMTPEQRSEVALAAARARWAKGKKR
jgi:hypothetical protein